MTTSLVVTVVGPDRPGIVNQLSDAAQRVGANWEASRMANLAGQFAGMVHFEVPDDRADALAKALAALESPDLHVVIARSQAGGAAPARRHVRLELMGHDRPGIVRELSGSLAERGVSIEELETHVSSAAMAGCGASPRTRGAGQRDDGGRGAGRGGRTLIVAAFTRPRDPPRREAKEEPSGRGSWPP